MSTPTSKTQSTSLTADTITPVRSSQHHPGSQGGVRWIHDRFDPRAVRYHVPGQWPMLGGPGALAPSSSWNDPSIRMDYRPHVRVSVRILGSVGLQALARDAHLPIFKLSVTQDLTEALDDRLIHLQDDLYAAWWRDGGEWRQDPGFDVWMIAPIPPIEGLSPHSPVSIRKRGIDVLLPDGMTPHAFDKALTERLGDARLDRFVMTEHGRRHVAALDLPIERLRRHTRYDVGRPEPRWSKAQEILIFKPKLHAARLVGLIEQVLLEASVQ